MDWGGGRGRDRAVGFIPLGTTPRHPPEAETLWDRLNLTFRLCHGSSLGWYYLLKALVGNGSQRTQSKAVYRPLFPIYKQLGA